MPTVMIDRAVEIGSYDTVRIDDRGVARTAVEHLARHGHQRIAFVGTDPWYATARDRLAGYDDAVAASDGSNDPALRHPTPSTDAQAVRIIDELLVLPDPPTAVFAANTRAGRRMAHALHTSGSADLAFISFGDFPLSQSLRPPVTYVDHDPRAVGLAATQRVLDNLGGEPGPPRDIVVATALVPRGSGEIKRMTVPR
jgi:LacI family transcriptional regulator